MATTTTTLKAPLTRSNALTGALAIAAVVVVGRMALSGNGAFDTFVLIFTSIVIEALPFILLGALVSALIEVYTPDTFFTRIAKLPLPLQIPGAAFGGMAFPVCECGSVPVARRLISKGVHP
ncbi:MAG: permease, partial [Actinomycetota bacterium]